MIRDYIEPMLAHEYKNKGLVLPVYVQPKLDGQRCLSVESGLWTRTGKAIVSVPLLQTEIKKHFPSLPLDGELYAHGSDFDFTMSTTRRTVNIKESNDVEYWVYDILDPLSAFSFRLTTLRKHFEQVAEYCTRIRLVPTYLCTTLEQVQVCMQMFLRWGFEGLMIRSYTGVYEIDKRSRYLLKMKEWKDVEGEVVGFEEGAGRNYGRLGALVCKLKSDVLVRVGTGLSDTMRDDIWEHKEDYLGKIATIKYQNLTKAGIPRFPSLLRWREEE